jgi:hypothetical protein
MFGRYQRGRRIVGFKIDAGFVLCEACCGKQKSRDPSTDQLFHCSEYLVKSISDGVMAITADQG